MNIIIEVKPEERPDGQAPLGSLFVNNRLVYRFDTVEEANLAESNLMKALFPPKPEPCKDGHSSGWWMGLRCTRCGDVD